MRLDPEKGEFYDILSIILGRLFLTLVLTVCLVVVLVFLLRHPNWPMAALEAFLAATCYKMVSFYFPVGGKKKAKKPKA